MIECIGFHVFAVLIVNIFHLISVCAMLRRLLTFLGVPVWKHFYTGLSRLFIRGIDMYMKTLSPIMRSTAGERAHYVLNVSRPWYLRQYIGQENWYLCRDWLFYGQQDPHFDTPISDPGLFQLTRSIVANPRAGMRHLPYFFFIIFVFSITCILYVPCLLLRMEKEYISLYHVCCF